MRYWRQNPFLDASIVIAIGLPINVRAIPEPNRPVEAKREFYLSESKNK
jgi:hypothetical protein